MFSIPFPRSQLAACWHADVAKTRVWFLRAAEKPHLAFFCFRCIRSNHNRFFATTHFYDALFSGRRRHAKSTSVLVFLLLLSFVHWRGASGCCESRRVYLFHENILFLFWRRISPASTCRALHSSLSSQRHAGRKFLQPCLVYMCTQAEKETYPNVEGIVLRERRVS